MVMSQSNGGEKKQYHLRIQRASAASRIALIRTFKVTQVDLIYLATSQSPSPIMKPENTLILKPPPR